MNRKLLIFLLIVTFCLSPVFASDFTVDQIISNLQANQSAIRDMSADTITKITSTMKGTKEMVQKGKILTKYPDMSKTETFSPIHQIMIAHGDNVVMINKDTGQRTEQKLPASAGGQMNFDKARETFDFSVKKDGDKYIIIGVPKAENKFLGKMEITIDPDLWLVEVVKIFTPQGKVISESIMEYSSNSGIRVLSKILTSASTPMGNMKIDMEYQNVKINQNIADEAFNQ